MTDVVQVSQSHVCSPPERQLADLVNDAVAHP